MVLASENVSDYPAIRPILEPVAKRNFTKEYADQQIKNWQEYTKSVLEGIDAVGLVTSNLATVLKNPDHIRIPQKLTTQRISYTFTHADGSVEEATFGMTGIKMRLRTGRKDKNAYVYVGIKSRGEDDRQDLEIGREVGVFLVESANGNTKVTYGQTNRQLPLATDTNPSHISSLFLEHLRGNIQQELTSIASNYVDRNDTAVFSTRRARTAVPIG